MKNSPKIWFITGASKGLGLALAQQVLALGDRVAATSRNLGELHAASERFLPLQVDLMNESSVASAIASTVEVFGSLDVVVNCAGYGQQGTFEALSDSELRRNFDVNLFAPLNVLRHALPQLRAQRSGHVINISSIVGFDGGYAGWGSYVASKFALGGVTEALAAEVQELGIKATVVYPGPVRTGFLSSASLAIAERRIDDYTAAQASLDLHQNTLDGQQAGDPDKIALAIIQAANVSEPPLHLFMGQIAVDLAQQKITQVQQDLNQWKATSLATDFPA
ncbi:SDR family NAD(P)-dependent oxidoreductase [Pseudomonas cucumis]|uniref:SDR family NAD(P)-dependent oxidoreductase n=1 Tax=Pseudomonas cucumis TaxID=2954082 RepID=A0ABY9ESS1_9PSED|nr:SDR family NAD(P)-dependent oxidoreductase [Pseudomonas cucumis]WLG83261.1 SDR family NAD(P)-dependent oxidoreductase [Pseudomonas cucumis]